MKLNNILVPVDFSKEAAQATEAAISLAQQHNSRVLLLHVIPANYGLMSDPVEQYQVMQPNPADWNEVKANTEKRMEQFKSEFESDVQINHIITRHYTESVSNVILEKEEKHNIDLIIMTTSGFSMLKTIFTEDHSGSVIHYADAPVITLTDAVKKPLEFKKILVPTDLNDISPEWKQQVYDICEMFNADFKFAFVKTPADLFSAENLGQRIKELAGNNGVNFNDFAFLEENAVAKGLSNYAEQEGFDLILMQTEERSDSSRVFFGSTTDQLIEKTPIPVLTIKQEAILA